MPIYEFEDLETGEKVELMLDYDIVPPIGEVRVFAGKRLKRLFPRIQPPNMGEFTVRAVSQKPWAKGADGYDEWGVPYLDGKRGVNRFLDAQRREVEKDGMGETGGEILGFDGSKTI